MHTWLQRQFWWYSRLCYSIPLYGGFGNLSTPRLFFNFNFAGEELGWEIYDPSPWQSTSDCSLYLASHPTGICRYSDAAVVDFRYLPADSVEFGYVARTMFYGSGVGIVGSRKIDPSNRHHEITEKYYSIPTGIYLDRLGVTSGWTYHNVSTACYTQYLEPEADGNPYYHAKLWCQYKTGGGTSGGDSGGPYWAYVYCTPSDPTRPDGTDCIRLAGVHWGRDDNTGRSLFSPISGIETDLGTLGVRVSDNP